MPAAAVRTIESTTERIGMGEGRIDDAVMADAEHQLIYADPGQSVVFGEQSVIGQVVQIKYAAEVVVIIGDPDKCAFAAATAFRWNQPMRVELPDAGSGWGRSSTAPPGIQKPAHG